MAMNDGGIFSSLNSRQDIHAQLEPYRDSDVGTMLWATFKGENCTYRSRLGRTLPTSANPFDRFSYSDTWDQTLRNLEAQGIDFMDEVVTTAQQMGLRIFSSLRLQGPKPVPMDMETGSFYERFPQFRCKDRNGLDIAHLSLAFPQVRQFWIDLLLETLDYGFDGVHVIFCRSHPFVLYEEPVIARFQEQYGQDPRQRPEDDPRLWRVMASFVNQFARQLRQAVQKVEVQTGRDLKIAYSINASSASPLPASAAAADFVSQQVGQSNLMWGVDIETIVRGGLADYLLPHPAVAKNAAAWLPALIELTRDTPIEIYPDLYPRRLPPAAALYSAQTFYELGADGLSLWDTYNRTPRLSEWALLKRMGHKDDIAAWRQQGKGSDYFRVLDLLRLGDHSGDSRYFQTNG
ncbi:MAG: hypothetical protein GKR89_10120 [Candidatus Latescibacteria bacterium]|nr:hypothetical protein [Candidatus Latescibacterota bacterium]